MSTYTYAQNMIGRSQFSLFILGNVGSILCYFVFAEKAAQKSACILYLMAYLTSNMVLINHSILMSTLNTVFGIDPTTHSLAYCRIKYYLSFVFDTLSNFFLIMASFDRVLITSINANTRMKSTRRFALISICVLTIFWLLFHIHLFFYINIVPINPRVSMCIPISTDYTSYMSYYSLFISAIIPTVFMGIFALKTTLNLKHLSRTTQSHLQRNERYLIVLLLIQVIFYLITHGPGLGYAIYTEVTKSSVKSNSQMLTDYFVRFVMQYLNYVYIALAPWVNFISNSFRRKTKDFFLKIFCQPTNRVDTQTGVVQPVASRTNH